MTAFLWIVAGLVALIVVVAWGVALGHGFDISDKSVDKWMDDLEREVDEQ